MNSYARDLMLVAIAALLVSCVGGESTKERTTSETGPTETGPVLLLSPSGGETYAVGDTVHIHWRVDTTVYTEVNIHLSPDSGRAWILLNTEKAVNMADHDWTDFVWAVPDTIRDPWDPTAPAYGLANTAVRVRISDYEGEDWDASGYVMIDAGY